MYDKADIQISKTTSYFIQPTTYTHTHTFNQNHGSFNDNTFLSLLQQPLLYIEPLSYPC